MDEKAEQIKKAIPSHLVTESAIFGGIVEYVDFPTKEGTQTTYTFCYSLILNEVIYICKKENNVKRNR